MRVPVYVPTLKKGFSHEGCYLAPTRGCSRQISREHSISRAVLDQIEKQNSTVDITGLSWLPKEEMKSIGKAALTAKVLCTAHNSALSPLDSSAADFIGSIGAIDKEFQRSTPTAIKKTIDGELLERWILKTAFGLVHSGQIKQRTGAPLTMNAGCLKLLCEPEARWPRHWGLYFVKTSGRIFHSSSLEGTPVHDATTGVLLALELRFNGLHMYFLMGDTSAEGDVGLHRPQGLYFQKDKVRSEILFSWGRKPAGPGIELIHEGTYTGPAPYFPKTK